MIGDNANVFGLIAAHFGIIKLRFTNVNMQMETKIAGTECL